MGILRFRNANNSGYIDPATATGFKFRNVANTGYIDKTSLNGLAIRNQTNTGWITFSAGVSYSITPSTTSVNEGQTVTFTIVTTGFGSGTLYWTNSGTTVGADFTDGQNSGAITITSNSGSFSRTLSNDATTEGSETIQIQLRTSSPSGPIVSTSSTVTVADTSTTPSTPTSLSLVTNDLDFYMLPVETSTIDSITTDLICTIDSSAFYSNATSAAFEHIAFVVDAAGDSGFNNPHCGPIIRRGQSLWSVGRGFIIFQNGFVQAEQWNGTFSPGFLDITNISGNTFNPMTTTTWTVRIRAGYRTGVWANTMRIDIYAGTNTFGTLLFQGIATGWGWDWNGTHKAGIAAIADGFVKPADTSCIEQIIPRSSPSATVGFSNFDLRLL